MEIKKLGRDYREYQDKEVKIYGWLRNKRVSKNVSFLNINDGTCFETIQVVFEGLNNQDEIEKLHVASAVEVTGIVKLTGKDNQPFELVATNVSVLADSKEDYPLQPKKHSYEFLREISHLRVRTNTFNSVFRIRSLLSFAVNDYFNSNGFVMIHAPIITASDAEGAGEMFQVTTLDMKYNSPKLENGEVDYKRDFFSKKASLTVSGQLLAEAYALAFSKVYSFGPTFRAEKSNTTRHAAEFWMIEPEIAFSDLDDCINLAQDVLVYCIDYILKNAPSEIAFLNNLRPEINLTERLNELVSGKFERITYTKAIEILEQVVKDGHLFENEVSWGVDLSTEHEKYLTDVIFKAPVFVTDYPKDIKAFYMRRNDDDKTVAAMDLLVPGIGELLGGSQREERIDMLKEMMALHGLNEEEYDWYLQLREYGGVQLAGFGIGFERLVMYTTGMENIRDVIPFARTPKNLDF
ncbi:MAG: asparagine--tRNA ligase [Mycoplasmatales bacterium]